MVSEIFGHIIRIVWSRFNDNIPPKNVYKHENITFVVQSRRYVSSPLPAHHVAFKPVLGKWFPPGVHWRKGNPPQYTSNINYALACEWI